MTHRLMNTTSKSTSPGALMLGLVWFVLICCGCEEVKLRDANQSQTLPKSDNALQATITARGLSAMIKSSLIDQNLPISAEPTTTTNLTLGADESIQLGPIEQTLKLNDIAITPDTDGFDVELTLRDVLVLVPTRQGRFDQTQLCRWRVQLPSITLNMRVGGDPSNSQGLRAVGTPTSASQPARVDAIGACALSTSLTANDQLATLHDELIAYATSAIERAVIALGTSNPLEVFGLIDGGVELTRQSDFSNRRGQLLIEGALEAGKGLALSTQGINISMRYGTQVTVPAACTPPIELNALQLPAPTPLSEAQLEQFKADLGVALPVAFVERLIQTTIKSGFLCRGLTSLGLSGQQSIAKQDILFNEVGIDTALFGEQTLLTFSPGSLPTFKSLPQENVLAVQWDDMTMELYTEILGATTRVARVRASARLRVKIERATSAGLLLNIETLTLEQADLDSPWSNSPPAETELKLWTRRLLLIALGEGFQVPLPLRPDIQTTVLGTQLRDNDIALYLRLEP